MRSATDRGLLAAKTLPKPCSRVLRRQTFWKRSSSQPSQEAALRMPDDVNHLLAQIGVEPVDAT
jgi:hypothetical protein